MPEFFSNALEFDCEGCGWHVVAPALEAIPVHGFCAVCAWLCEYVPDPEEMMRVRKLLGDLGRGPNA
jgi:hypothetical protein